MLCLDSSIKHIKKKGIDLHDKKIYGKNLDLIIEELSIFESKTKDLCYPIGINALRKNYNINYLKISGMSAIQDYVCRRENIEYIYNVLKELGYNEIENPFIIEVECENRKIEVLSSCSEEKVFKKDEIYIAIFPERSIYYKIKGRKILEETIIIPKDAEKFTIFSKILRYNKKDFTDIIFLALESGNIFNKIDEKDVLNFVFDYSEAARLDRRDLINQLYLNLVDLLDNLERIIEYRNRIFSSCCYSPNDFNVSFVTDALNLYLFNVFNTKKEHELLIGYSELKRIMEIIKNINK
ncbi:MAG: hypothetical protein QW038_02065 [Nanopusillaceae archaeon]